MKSEPQTFAAAFAEATHAAACRHLLRHDDQEDLCFALWYPSVGTRRQSALIRELVLPQPGDRRVHGNASFSGDYFARVVSLAVEKRAGIALMHSHLGPGWQGLSRDDYVAEDRLAGRAQAATGLPFVGVTFGNDGSCSARFWRRTEPRVYVPDWCESVRVAGHALRMTYHPELKPLRSAGAALERTVGVLGERGQADFSRLALGIAGLGSVGSLVNEAVARMGSSDLTHVEYDTIEERCERAPRSADSR